jgi:hypothetical protein
MKKPTLEVPAAFRGELLRLGVAFRDLVVTVVTPNRARSGVEERNSIVDFDDFATAIFAGGMFGAIEFGHGIVSSDC